MRRVQSKVSVGGGMCRITVKIYSGYCESDSPKAAEEQVFLLKQLAANQELLICGFKFFEKFLMRHTGDCWLVEMEATQSE